MNKEEVFKLIEKEGNLKVFLHKGYPCIIRRLLRINAPIEIGGMFHLCGYVGVPKGHKLFGKNYDDVGVKVHGGLTFGSKELGDGKHWFFGFDCAHSGDICYYMKDMPMIFGDKMGETYKDMNYVEKQVRSLAEQLKRREK